MDETSSQHAGDAGRSVITSSIAMAIHQAMNRDYFLRQLRIVEDLLRSQGIRLVEGPVKESLEVPQAVIEEISAEFWSRRFLLLSPAVGSEDLESYTEMAVSDGTAGLYIRDFLSALVMEGIFPVSSPDLQVEPEQEAQPAD